MIKISITDGKGNPLAEITWSNINKVFSHKDCVTRLMTIIEGCDDLPEALETFQQINPQ